MSNPTSIGVPSLAPRIVKTVVGRAIHSPHPRQPIVPQQGTGYGPGYQPKVPATAVVNPLQRQPPDY